MAPLRSYIIIALVIVVVIIGWRLVAGTSFQVGGPAEQTSQDTPSIEPAPIDTSTTTLPAEKPAGPLSPLTGLPCTNAERRPIAIMIAGDDSARPVAGLQAADLVIEMPVVTDGINRFLAFYICNEPQEVGAARSARHDFIPLAAGFDAIFAHWGGSHFALARLAKKIIDNIDALPNPYNAFYRKSGYRAPNNGFTTVARLRTSAAKLGYRLTTNYEGFGRDYSESLGSPTAAALELGFPGKYAVKWDYDPESQLWERTRDGRPEIDRLTNEQVRTKNIAVMRAPSRQIEGQYNDVDVEGEGDARFYINGTELTGIWRKSRASISSPLEFLDDGLKPVLFAPGQIWIEIIEPERSVTYSQ